MLSAEIQESQMPTHVLTCGDIAIGDYFILCDKQGNVRLSATVQCLRHHHDGRTYQVDDEFGRTVHIPRSATKVKHPNGVVEVFYGEQSLIFGPPVLLS